MRKRLLDNSNGFTLVELMIVVVIMGILVAVAIPVYNAVTKNSRVKTCHTNCEILEQAATQYMMNTEKNDISALVAQDAVVRVAYSDEFYDKFPQEYTDNIKKPLDIFDGGCVYDFYYGSGGKALHVICIQHGDRSGHDNNGSLVE